VQLVVNRHHINTSRRQEFGDSSPALHEHDQVKAEGVARVHAVEDVPRPVPEQPEINARPHDQAQPDEADREHEPHPEVKQRVLLRQDLLALHGVHHGERDVGELDQAAVEAGVVHRERTRDGVREPDEAGAEVVRQHRERQDRVAALPPLEFEDLGEEVGHEPEYDRPPVHAELQ